MSKKFTIAQLDAARQAMTAGNNKSAQQELQRLVTEGDPGQAEAAMRGILSAATRRLGGGRS